MKGACKKEDGKVNEEGRREEKGVGRKEIKERPLLQAGIGVQEGERTRDKERVACIPCVIITTTQDCVRCARLRGRRAAMRRALWCAEV